MKKVTTLLIAIVLVPALAFSQSKSIAEFHAKYRNMDHTTFVDISGSLFNFASKIAEYSDEDDDETKAAGRVLSAIKAMQVLEVPYKMLDKADISGLKSKMAGEKYEELMTVKEDDSNINILAQGSGSKLENITFLIDEDDSFVLVTIQGTLSMEDISYFAKHQKDWH
ncbi:MAG: DUF4252 domain-containing protein [Cyclobacteriaceae bacterium]|nr:DUF4252 domain-containing protein [Cyclobacteriaceae bacterium]